MHEAKLSVIWLLHVQLFLNCTKSMWLPTNHIAIHLLHLHYMPTNHIAKTLFTPTWHNNYVYITLHISYTSSSCYYESKMLCNFICYLLCHCLLHVNSFLHYQFCLLFIMSLFVTLKWLLTLWILTGYFSMQLLGCYASQLL